MIMSCALVVKQVVGAPQQPCKKVATRSIHFGSEEGVQPDRTRVRCMQIGRVEMIRGVRYYSVRRAELLAARWL